MCLCLCVEELKVNNKQETFKKEKEENERWNDKNERKMSGWEKDKTKERKKERQRKKERKNIRQRQRKKERKKERT